MPLWEVLRAFLVSEVHPTLNVVGINLWGHFNDDGLICSIATRSASRWGVKVAEWKSPA